MYRPDNWETPYKLPSTDTRRTLDMREAFESGADTMLESILSTLSFEERIWLGLRLTGQRWGMNLVEVSNG